MKRVLAGLLVIIMVFSIVPFAEGTSVVNAQESMMEDTRPLRNHEVVEQVNPLYADLVDEEEIVYEEISEQLATLAEPEYETDLHDVLEGVRKEMVNRTSTVKVYYAQTTPVDVNFLSEWLDIIFEETENSKEGDFLHWHYKSVRVNPSYSYGDDGYYYYDMTFSFTYLTTLQQERELDLEVANVLRSIGASEGLSDYTNIKKIYDYICANITYDYENLNDSSYSLMYTAYAALIHKTAVCQGYASLFYYMAREVGLNVRVIAGYGNSGPHGWNIVELNGKYYYLDSTWDAGMTTYDFFLKGSKNFINHENWIEYTTEEFLEEHPISSTDYVSGTSATYNLISTASQWYAIANGASGTLYRLNADITVSSLLTIGSNKQFVIDLNGHTVSSSNNMIKNNGVLTIIDSGEDGTIKMQIGNSSKNAIVNNGALFLKSGNIDGVLSYSASSYSTTMNARVKTIDNYGELYVSGGSITCMGVARIDKAYLYLYGIYNNADATLEMIGGDVANLSAASSYSTLSTYYYLTSYGIYNASDYDMRLANVSIVSLHTADSVADTHLITMDSVRHDSDGCAYLENSAIISKIEGTPYNSVGQYSGICNAAEGVFFIDESKIYCSETEAVEGIVYGAINLDAGEIIIGKTEKSNTENTAIVTEAETAADVALSNKDETGYGMISLRRGIAYGSSGIYTPEAGNGYYGLGLDDGTIDSEQVILAGSVASILNESKVYMYDGCMVGAVSSDARFGYAQCSKVVESVDDGTPVYTLVSQHVYSYTCDETCNTCGRVRTSAHSYVTKYNMSSHWEQCSICGQQGTFESHSMGTWHITKNASYSQKGEKNRTCLECDYSQKQEIACWVATSVSLDADRISVKEPCGVQLKVICQPNEPMPGDVTWSSSNTRVATVNQSGYVSILASGTATITVTVGNVSDSCVVSADIETPISQFVTRLYRICLNREPDDGGKADWIGRLQRRQESGVGAASGFVFSQEFKNKNLCNDDYVEQLYLAFMGRSSDEGGKSYWVGNLEAGMTREQVFNGFALSSEFGALCTSYCIEQGNEIPVPVYGTIPTGCCAFCGKEDGVTSFVKRLYSICLSREADEDGLNYWTNRLWGHNASGKGVAFGFVFSQEFANKNTSNAEFVEYLYLAFMGRGSDPGGKADWVNRLNRGWSRNDVFNGFAGSMEFNNICNSYGITRE